MTQSDPTSRRLLKALGVAAIAGASAVTIALPPNTATADPVPPSPTTAAPAPPPADPNAPAPAPADPNALPPAPPADPNAPPPPPADPNAPAPAPADPNAPPPPPADPNAPAPAPADPNAPEPAPAPEPGRVENASGGFSYVVPAGWEVADASRLSYGQALLLKQTSPALPGMPGETAPTANDTSILLGRLDLKLFAGAEPDNGKAAVRLASDMGEFFMPFPGSRINQQTTPLQAGDLPGSAASYEVKFTDTAKPNGQIWAGVVGTAGAQRSQPNDRWFVVWLGTSEDPVDAAAATTLAQSIKQYTPPPPPPPPPPDPNAPVATPEPGNRVGIPIPVETPVPEMMPAG